MLDLAAHKVFAADKEPPRGDLHAKLISVQSAEVTSRWFLSWLHCRCLQDMMVKAWLNIKTYLTCHILDNAVCDAIPFYFLGCITLAAKSSAQIRGYYTEPCLQQRTSLRRT